MRRYKIYILFFLLVLSDFLLSTCEKQEYDLFPLNVGNEFYYTYKKDDLFANTRGTVRWKVISVSSQGHSNTYTIERKLTGTIETGGGIIIISDSLNFFEISENKSSLLSSSSIVRYTEITFERYQQNPEFEINHKSEGTQDVSWNCLFKADSGLTKYSYYHPPNSWCRESLHLDSLKIYR